MMARFLAGFLAMMLVWSSLGLSSSAASEDKPAVVPILGIPYASTTGSGKPFNGTVQLHFFESTGDGLIAQALLRDGKRAVPLAFPVEVLRADCLVLELRIGPPDHRGLLFPLVVFETPHGGGLSHADFCRNAEALAAGDFDQLATLLNGESPLPDAGFEDVESCPWHHQLNCRASIEMCAVPCAIGFCAECAASVGAPSCLPCLQ